MYALIVLVPFVLLATVMGLSWWEEYVLPTAEPAEAPAEPPTPLAAPPPHRELTRIETAPAEDVSPH
ncbi:hypothetical protein ABZY19_38215 [Streptomyces sp. NPDC006475]|uniref:hypothetical protein n=1 Tax=Streptomyces sp. NPDC006475 TaxID=3155719 RepID=UPI0033A5A304